MILKDGASFKDCSIGGFSIAGSSPFLWLDASDSSTLYDATSGGSPVTTNGGSVKRWEDKSGNGRHATEATNFPSLKTGEKNSLNCLDFATGKYLTSSFSSTLFSSETVFVVFKYNITANYGRLFSQSLFGSKNDFNTYIPLIRDSTNNKICSYFSGSLSSVSVVSGNWYIAMANNSGSNVLIKANATSVSGASTVLNQNFDRFRICASINSNDSSDGAAFGNSIVGEVIAYNRSIPSDIYDIIFSYLNAKWAIY